MMIILVRLRGHAEKRLVTCGDSLYVRRMLGMSGSNPDSWMIRLLVSAFWGAGGLVA